MRCVFCMSISFAKQPLNLAVVSYHLLPFQAFLANFVIREDLSHELNNFLFSFSF